MDSASGDESKRNTKIVLAFVLASLLILGGVAALIVDVITRVPDFKDLKGTFEIIVELPNDKTDKRTFGPKTKAWVPISQISNYALQAVIASEDTSFFSHEGVDFHELKEAIKKDWKEKKWARGASTITQQVVKNVYLSREKTLWRKFKEFFWARKLDEVASKNEILNIYFNIVEFGPNVYGIREAASHYFNTSPANLSLKQSAFLAMLLPSPKKYHANFQKRQLSDWAQSRVDRILEIMLKMGFIEEEEYQDGLSEILWEGSNGAGAGEEVPTLSEGDDIGITPTKDELPLTVPTDEPSSVPEEPSP